MVQNKNTVQSFKLNDYSSDMERRFQEETVRIRAEKNEILASLPFAERTEPSPKQKRWLVGGAILVASLVTAAGVGRETVGQGLAKLFPDASPPITKPVNEIINNNPK